MQKIIINQILIHWARFQKNTLNQMKDLKHLMMKSKGDIHQKYSKEQASKQSSSQKHVCLRKQTGIYQQCWNNIKILIYKSKLQIFRSIKILILRMISQWWTFLIYLEATLTNNNSHDRRLCKINLGFMSTELKQERYLISLMLETICLFFTT